MKKTKDQVQNEAVLALERNNGNGLIAMATGTGKSKVAIDYLKMHPEFKKVLIVVPTEKLRDVNWKNEFDKWNASEIWNTKVERSCYISINKIKNMDFDVVILDECHNITENNSQFFYHNRKRHIIGLTATFPENFLKVLLLRELHLDKSIYTVSLDEAVEWGLVSPYRITIIETKLDTIRRNVQGGSKKRPFYQTEFEAYIYISSQIDKLMYKERSPGEQKRMEMLILRRMRLIYTLKSKTEIAEFLLKNAIPQQERTLIFCGGIDQANHLNEYSFHSKSKNSEGYDKFVSQEVSRLSCVNSLNEGHNLPNVDNALIVQLNSKELNLVQRCGRVVRYRHGHIANIFIIMVKDTVDEKWTIKATENLGNGNIEKISFANLKMQYV